MKPLSTFYNAEVSKWLRNHPGRTVTIFQMAELITLAFKKSATAQTAANGFRKTGLWPVNCDVFEAHEYAPSGRTDRPLPQSDSATDSDHEETYTGSTGDPVHVGDVTVESTDTAAPPTNEIVPFASPVVSSASSHVPESTVSADHGDPSPQTCTPAEHVPSTFYGKNKRPYVSPYDISPLPHHEFQLA